jgi:hypothetical protein
VRAGARMDEIFYGREEKDLCKTREGYRKDRGNWNKGMFLSARYGRNL